MPSHYGRSVEASGCLLLNLAHHRFYCDLETDAFNGHYDRFTIEKRDARDGTQTAINMQLGFPSTNVDLCWCLSTDVDAPNANDR